MKRILIALVAVAVLGACNGGDDDDATSTTTTEAVAGPTVPGQTLPTGNDDAPGEAKRLPWPAPDRDVVALIQKAGLKALPSEQLEYHVHAHLDVYLEGNAQAVPANLGIDLEERLISPLHTHDETGIIHVENDKKAVFRLGQLFTEWDVRLDANCAGAYCAPTTPVAFYVNGKKFTGDPRTIELERHTQIALVIGAPPRSIPSEYDWPPNV